VTRRGAVAATVAVAAALVAACSGSSSPSVAPTTTTPTTAGTTTTTTAVTTTAPCASPPAPAAMVRATKVTGDVDGTGAADTVTVYGTGTATAPGPWFVAVDLGAAGRRQAPIADADPDDATQDVRVLGVATAGGSPVVFAAVGTGSSATIVGLFQLVGCELVRVMTPTAGPATYAVGGTVTHLDGLRCRDGQGIDVLSAKSVDGTTYTGTTTPIMVTGGQVTAEPPTSEDAVTESELRGYGGLVCPGVETL
jgi:hypothetical protein